MRNMRCKHAGKLLVGSERARGEERDGSERETAVLGSDWIGEGANDETDCQHKGARLAALPEVAGGCPGSTVALQLKKRG